MLRKWRSSSDELLATIPVELRETETKQHIQSPSSHIKTIGLHWDTGQDSLHVAMPVLDQDASPTKRRILSNVFQIFDVLGWFSPFTIPVKALIQQLWLLKIGWDDPVPDNLAQIWQDWRDQLHLVTTVAIPRYYHDKQKTIRSIQVHGFSDSSEIAYGGAVYLRTTCTDATITTALVIAKSKVTPLKKLTIPKLELCAVLLTSKLVQTVSAQLSVDPSNVFGWSDSTITLQWLRTHHSLKTYVSNRVTATTSRLPASHWKHVPTRDNPADINSRGMTITELIDTSIWWEGPPWLRDSPDHRPSQPEALSGQVPEVKNLVLTLHSE